jgi:hypothetical protein
MKGLITCCHTPNHRSHYKGEKTMARKTTFIPSNTAGMLVPMEQIPQDVIDDIEEAFKLLSGTDGRIRVEFDTKEEKALFSQHAASYAAQRPDGKLKFRWSPSKGLPETAGDFRVTRDLPANGETRQTTDGPAGS